MHESCTPGAVTYLVLRDDGAAEVVFASLDEIERDRVLEQLRAAAEPGVAYMDDLVAPGTELVDELLADVRRTERRKAVDRRHGVEARRVNQRAVWSLSGARP